MDQIKCPRCGTVYVAQGATPMMTRNSGWKVTHYRPMADSVQAPPFGQGEGDIPAPQVNFTEARRKTPARSPTIPSDVGVPFFHSIITGVVVGVPVGILIVHFTPAPWWFIPLSIGSCSGITWLVLLNKNRGLLWLEETIKNEAEEIKGMAREIVVKAELHTGDDETDHINLATLPAPSFDYLKSFAEAVLNGVKTFSERDAQRSGYSRIQWKDLRDAFIMAGWAAWKDPEHHNQGVILTRAGKAILAEIVRIED